MYKIQAALILLVVLVTSAFIWNVYPRAYSYKALHIIKPKYIEFNQGPGFRIIKKDLIQYALDKINNDRIRFNLPPIGLGENIAAQVHAEDLFKTRYPYPTHWTTDGMKPYMKYSLYGGTGNVQQNVAIRGYRNTTVQECKSNAVSCDTLNPYKEIDQAEWKMVYNDTLCCRDAHKNNILDKHHTNVSLGIMYDEYYFAFVQNFENNYIRFNKPLTQDNKHIEISGIQLNNDTLDSVGIYYDDLPSQLTYEENKNKNSYEFGRFIASVVRPPPLLLHYKPPSNYTLIEADKWSQNNQSVDIGFDLSSVLKNKGVYTIVVYLTDKDRNKFPVTSYSIFAK